MNYRRENRKAMLFGIFITQKGTLAAMMHANDQLANPVLPSTVRNWHRVWSRLPYPRVMDRFGKF